MNISTPTLPAVKPDAARRAAAATPLPLTLSGVIRRAIADGKSISRAAYIPTADKYHEPFFLGLSGDDSLCAVCFAGVVMAQSKRMPPTAKALPGEFDDYTASRLVALDEVRRGNLLGALALLDPDYAPAPEIAALLDVDPPLYADFANWAEFDEFCEWAAGVADTLESVGL